VLRRVRSSHQEAERVVAGRRRRAGE
jgi:hypothetical protein